MKTKSELYQLRADIIRGRVLSQEETLEIVEELQSFASEEWVPVDQECDGCSDLIEELRSAEGDNDRLESRIDKLVGALEVIASGRLKIGDIADFAEQAIEGPRKKLAKVFELMEARP